MRPKSIWEYVHFGMQLGAERFWGWYCALDGDVAEVKERIGVTDEGLIATLEKLDFRGALGVEQYIMQPNPRLDGVSAGEGIEILISAIKSESESVQVFAVTEKRWDTKKLLNNVSALFAPRVFSRLHEVAQSDFIDAGKCIAFELPTSAAFHLMRGTEMVLRQFYLAKTGEDYDDKTWGAILSDLRKAETPRSLKALYDNLNNIKDNFRNPTQHPDALYDIDQAQDLFGECISVVNQMIPIIVQQ